MNASGIYITVSPEDPSHSENKLITDEDGAELMHMHVCIFMHHDAHQSSC